MIFVFLVLVAVNNVCWSNNKKILWKDVTEKCGFRIPAVHSHYITMPLDSLLIWLVLTQLSSI